MLQMAQRKNTELDDEHWCLFEICEIPKSDLQITNKKIFQYSKKQKQEGTKRVGSIGGNKFLSQFIVGLAPEQNEITVEVKGMVRAKVNSDVNFASRNLFPQPAPDPC